MIERRVVESAFLGQNLLGNPGRRELVVYLPPSYADTSRSYPSIYLLHGFSSRAASWLIGPAVAFGAPLVPIDALLDEAINKRLAREMIVVMPDGWSKYGCSQWVDSPTTGYFEQYITRDVVEYVDAEFRTIAASASRGVTGISSGGNGAWNLGSRHPDVFGAMAPLSADSYFEASIPEQFANMFDHVFPSAPDGPVVGVADSWLCYGLATAYTPNVARPPHYADLPFTFPTGEVVPDLWDRWLSYDPIRNWSSRLDSLRKMRGILLDVGSHDQFRANLGHRILSDALTSVGIKHDAREYDGGHTTYLQRERVVLAYEWFSEVLQA